MPETQHLYMKRFSPEIAVIIQFCWGKYYVSHLFETERGAATKTIRQYKTLMGAERFLRDKISNPDRSAVTAVFYGTEQVIREGKYWRR